jgi:aminoglycoside 2''-phosphotransferase
MDEGTCVQAILSQDPDFPIVHVQRLNPGWDSAVFLVNTEWIFRFPTRQAVADSLERELRLVPIIAERTGTPVPRFDFVGDPSDVWPYPFAGYFRLPGRALDGEASVLSRDIVRAIGQQVGAFLRELHRIPFAPAIEVGVPPFSLETWIDDRARLIDQALDAVNSWLVDNERASIRDHYRALFDRIDWSTLAPALLHGDLSSEHILIDLEGAVHVSIIDFGDLQIGDPALDFAGLPEPVLPYVLESYGMELGQDFPARQTLYKDLVPAYAVQAGVELGRQDLIREGLDGLRRLTERIRWLRN